MNRKRTPHRFAACIALCILLCGWCCARVSAASPSDEAQSIAQGIIAWKKADNGAAPDGDLINDTYLAQAGTTPGDWYPIGLGRWGIADNNAGYLAVLKDQVMQRYAQPGKLSAAKATEWHRIALAVRAMGGDPTNFGTDADGQPINLIADGTYNRGRTTPLGRQGINGWIWGLIALDSMRYDVPADAYNTRDDIIIEILRQQLPDGGFALSGASADPDITAMALQALAPYYNSEQVYTYTKKSTGQSVAQTVAAVTDEALDCLSAMQLDTGDFKSWGTENVESTDQVLVALCCLGIDPLTDARFVKNGVTLLDGILRYRMADGGFVHSFTYDADNPTSLPDRSNTMAGEQTLYAMAALWRQQNGLRTLYDMRPEQSSALRARIADLSARLADVTPQTDRATLEALLTAFYALPESERSYVRHYWTLSDAAKSAGIDVARIAATTPIVESPADDADTQPLLYFSASDRAAADALPTPLTTEQYVTVTTLLDKLEASEDFDGKAGYQAKLQAARTEIAAIQAEIDQINADIKSRLYPLDAMTVRNKPAIDDIVSRCEALSPYDRAQITGWDDVVKTKTKVDNQLRGIFIGAGVAAVCAGTAFFLIRRIRARRRKKQAEMDELAQQYADEDEEP